MHGGAVEVVRPERAARAALIPARVEHEVINDQLRTAREQVSQRPAAVGALKMVEEKTLDRAYAALADPTRRALLVALRNGRARISDLAEPLPMTFAGVSRHVGVLEEAGLIRREVRGREHWLSVEPDGLRQAALWISEQSSFWSLRADALADRLERRERQT